MFNFFKKNYFIISMDEAKKNIEKDPSITIIDVRTPAEYKSGHIPKAVNIPLDKIDQATGIIKKLDAPIYAYCLSGHRSKHACNQLCKAGYTNVTHIGGIGSWSGPLKK